MPESSMQAKFPIKNILDVVIVCLSFIKYDAIDRLLRHLLIYDLALLIESFNWHFGVLVKIVQL